MGFKLVSILDMVNFNMGNILDNVNYRIGNIWFIVFENNIRYIVSWSLKDWWVKRFFVLLGDIDNSCCLCGYFEYSYIYWWGNYKISK